MSEKVKSDIGLFIRIQKISIEPTVPRSILTRSHNEPTLKGL